VRLGGRLPAADSPPRSRHGCPPRRHPRAGPARNRQDLPVARRRGARAARGRRLAGALRIVVDERKDELRAPVGALFRRGEGWAAFVVRDGRAREVAVQVGRATPGFAEVLGGLAAGDVAVLYPRELMVDGAPVRPQGARRSLPNADYPCGTARRTVAPRRTRRR